MEHGAGSFRGLFIGVDKYLSDEIQQLRTARWDVAVVHALLTDNLADASFTLMGDEEVTRPRLLAELELLQATCEPDDTVVIMFSGHGSTTHHLITHDTDLNDLAGTALPLVELLDRVRSMPARHAVVLLDCCFSGGAGAKGVVSPDGPDKPAAVPVFDGVGMLVAAACAADEGAHEDRRTGHGLFSGQVIKALLGRAEVTAQDEVPLRDLFALVRRQVANRADLLGLAQNPVVFGATEPDLVWPVMTAGPRYRALVGPEEPPEASADLWSLREHGLTDAVLAVWQDRLGRINDLQRVAVNRGGVLRHESLVVVAPTAAGKTMVGEMAAVRSALCRGRAVFLVPTRALVNELHSRFTDMYGNLGIPVVRATGTLSSDIPAIISGRYLLGVFTYETYAGLVQAHPELLDQITTLVVDEVQAIADPERGAALELFLTSVLSRPAPRRPQIVALSTGLGEDYGHLDTWLEADPLRWSDRPVPLVEGTLTPDGVFRYRTDRGEESIEQLTVRPKYDPDFDAVLETIREEVRRGGRVIVFRRSRWDSVADARRLGEALGQSSAKNALAALPRGDDTRVLTALAACLRNGVAFHTADLGDEARRVVEDAFRAPGGEVRVLVCTTSLAQGVNFPADLVVVRDLGDRPGPDRWARTVAEHKNMVGRAGRASLGRAVVPVLMGDPHDVFGDYVRGVPDRVRSSLLGEPDLDSLVLRVLAALCGGDRLQVRSPDLHAFIHRGFAAHQSRSDGSRYPLTHPEVWTAVEHLESAGLLSRTGDDLLLTSLGEVVSSGTLRVSSAVGLVRLIKDLAPEDVTGELLLVAAQCTAELDAVRVDWAPAWRTIVTRFTEQGFPRSITHAVVNVANSFDRVARALICLQWVRLISMAEIERRLGNRPNQILPINPVLSRTRDVIDGVVRLALELHPSINRAELVQLPVQLDHGVPAAFAEFAVRARHSVDRWDYQCLWRHYLRDVESVRRAEVSVLATVLGDDLDKALTVLRLANEVAEEELAYDRLFGDPV